MAAVLAAGPGALASHRSAALLHGLAPTGPPPVDVVVQARPPTVHGARSKAANGLDGVRVHRQRDLVHTASHRVAPRRTASHRVDGIPCTNVLRTLIDLGAVAPTMVHGAVGHALANDLASLDAIESTLLAHARRGRGGVSALRRALDDWSPDAEPADSVLEPAMSRLVHRYGLPPVEFHARVGGREVDFRIVGTPIVVECDGWRHHGRSRERIERDRALDAEFAAHGWIVLRFTYRTITTRPSDVARRIRRTIDRWTDRPAPGVA